MNSLEVEKWLLDPDSQSARYLFSPTPDSQHGVLRPFYEVSSGLRRFAVLHVLPNVVQPAFPAETRLKAPFATRLSTGQLVRRLFAGNERRRLHFLKAHVWVHLVEMTTKLTLHCKYFWLAVRPFGGRAARAEV